MSGSSPGWPYGYAPSAGEWNAAFAGKQDYSAILAQLILQGGAPSYVPPTAWTPTDASGASLVFTSISAQAAVIGNVILLSASLAYPTTVDTSAAIIGGLPYPVPNQGYAAAPALVYVVGAAAGLINTVINSSTAELIVLASGAAIQNVALSGKVISFALAYPLS